MPTIQPASTRAAAAAGDTAAAPPAGPDYDAPATLVVSEPHQLRALADDVRQAIVAVLREHARSTQQLAEELGIPKGTVGHHLKVLERAGLIHVVRTRQVRALTEKFYGRTARLFIYQTEDPADERALGAAMLRRAAHEIDVAAHATRFGFPKSRLTPKDAARLERRLRRLLDDFIAAESATGKPYALAVAFYERSERA